MKKTAVMGLLLALALILSYVESLIPLPVGIPGIKLGLANLAIVLAIYLVGEKNALLLTVSKALLCGLLFGNMTMILYNLAGAVLSFFAMALMKRSERFHLPVISAAGGVMHNAGQLLVACLIVSTYGILYYIPFLLIAGLGTGMVIGSVAVLVLPAAFKGMNGGERE